MTSEAAAKALREAGYVPCCDLPQSKSKRTTAARSEPEHVYQLSLIRHFTPLIGPPGNHANRLGVSIRAFDQGQKRSQIIQTKNGPKRVNFEAQKAKARGVRRGVSDLLVRWPKGLAWIECKAGKNGVSDDQNDFFELMAFYGDWVKAFWDYEGVKPVEDWLRSIGCPLLGKTTA